MQTDLIAGNAVPRRTGEARRDEIELRRYLFRVMEQLRFALLELEKRLPKTEDDGALGTELTKLKGEIDSVEDQMEQMAAEPHKIPFGHVDAGSSATVMTATVDGVTELSDGVAAYIMNGVVTSASGFTLNVNGLGAKPVYSSLAAESRSTTIFNANYTMLFVYNSSRVEGGCWDVFYGYDSNTNTIGYQLRTNSMTLPMSDTCYRYRLLFTSVDGTKWVPANTSTSTNATASRAVCQTPINPFGRIVYYGYTTALKVTASEHPSPGTAYLWSQYVVTLGYSFNRTGAALTLTNPAPVYIKAAPQNDGSAILDDTTPYVQALPSTEDGKIYIYLGTAVSATQVEIVPEHPVYQFKDGRVKLWTG